MSPEQPGGGGSNGGGGGSGTLRPPPECPLLQHRPEMPTTSQQPPQPSRQPISFDDVEIKGAPDSVIQLVETIRHVAQGVLFHWRTFPLCLPAPLASSSEEAASPANGTSGTSAGDSAVSSSAPVCPGSIRRAAPLRDLFIAPSFDELDAVAVDARGEPRLLTGKQLQAIQERGLDKDRHGKAKRLDDRQLESIRETGEFEVDSVNFPGQTHRWKLNPWIQKGVKATREALLDDLALALRFLLITAAGRLYAHFFSIKQSICTFGRGLARLLDLLFGLPASKPLNLEARLREERSRCLVAELVPRPELEDTADSLCSFVRRQLRRAATEKFPLEKESSAATVPVPYLFLTPKRLEVDLRLFSRELMRRALPILNSILEREARGWFLHFRERLLAELRARKLADEELEREANAAVTREYLSRVYAAILASSELQAMGEGLPQLLVDQAQAAVLMCQAVESVRRRLSRAQHSLRQRIHDMYPIRARIAPWLRGRLTRAEAHFIAESQWSAHEEALALCTGHSLHQAVYFLHRDLIFMREMEPVLRKELRKVRQPIRTFLWQTPIWMPSKWFVRRSFQGQSEIIPTVVSNQATSITVPRSDPSQPVFLVEKARVRSTNTRWPLWRWANYCLRTYTWTLNAMFFLGVVIPWCSPVSIRALCCRRPFMPDLELSQVNGTLFPRKSSRTPTLCSRLTSLWRHISKSRTHFETQPDTGFIGKGVTRHANKVWNYAGKGIAGTLALIIVFPAICLTTTGTSLALMFTAPLWMPVLTLVFHLSMAIIYDWDCPDPATRNRFFILGEAIVWNILIQGLCQPLGCLFVALFLCPLAALAVLGVGVSRWAARRIWDSAAYHLLIKKRGRVPAGDSLIAKRVAGPGLGSRYFLAIGPEQAIATLEARLELDELAAFQQRAEKLIGEPQRQFRQFVEACFGPFGGQLAPRSATFRSLEREARDLTAILHDRVSERRRALHTGLAARVRSRVRLSANDLQSALHQGAALLEKHYPTRVIARLSINEDEFWEAKGVPRGDWLGLAGLLLADTFGADILTPLNDSDTRFPLCPAPQIDLSRYEVLARQWSPPGPDLLGPIFAPRGNIRVDPPFLQISAFNPRANAATATKPSLGASIVAGTSGTTSVLGLVTATPTDDATTSVNINTPNTSASVEQGGESNETNTSNNGPWRPWKRRPRTYSAEMLPIPLPIPHPARIAVTIHNRDADEPIPLDAAACQGILRGVEDSLGLASSHGLATPSGGAGAADTLATLGGGCDDTDADPEEDDGDDEEDRFSFLWDGGVWPSQPNGTTGQLAGSLTGTGASLGNDCVRVELASPEDVSLETVSQYGTTV